MSNFVEFVYREFFDVPREILFEYQGAWYFLRSSFDAAADDYESDYTAYRLPPGFVVPSGAWLGLPGEGAEPIGVMPVKDLVFDPSRRSRIELPRVVSAVRQSS